MAALLTEDRSSVSPLDCYIIHEVYDGELTHEQFEYELESALEHQYRYIVIEPARLGDETARWISVGNCLHRTAILTGTMCLLSPFTLPTDYSCWLGLPTGMVSIVCATLYKVSWEPDPCCKYQVEYNACELSRLPLSTLRTSAPVVLVRRDDTSRKRLHNVIAMTALAYCLRKLFELYTD
ncbi:transmembrane protein 11-A, mitochondrial-like [Protopterus annectens]|uniref:transmembrane protein 11-A, mitochondrial-like n=1 Tax=Protopterus annectens TaxID=7888 RepID=UPI001CF9B2DF|nr:transmembrane protein 11-A, mitochondrial-like [Protopterus annectens]